ncbi:MAG: MBOAT family O-acyltransferase [Lachnospiraceae bacterium]
MLFCSMKFVFVFIPIFFLLYYLMPERFRNAFLFVGSVCFYAFGEWKYLPLLLVSLLINYFIALLIHGAKGPGRKKLLLVLSLIYNFGMLFVFKYLPFLAGELGIPFETFWALPLGISFYTFQIVSYVLDVYWERIRAEKSVIYLGTYLCMFPQLIAGPIVIYSDIREQIDNRKYSLRNIEDGLKTFVIGLAYKMLIANVLGSLWNQLGVTGYESISTPIAWLGMFAYTFQIYFDFNGYSLMAIGLGKMLGFDIPRNFDHPYTSKSITEFWRRWHITLGSWFREYVYIPLGGSRKGKARLIFNLFIVWTLTGIWHGAGWNFVIWGLLLFALIAIEKLGFMKILERFKPISVVYMLLIVPMSWMVFAIDNIKNLGIYFGRLFPFLSATTSEFVNNHDVITALTKYGLFFVAAIIFSSKLPEQLYNKNKNRLWMVLLLLIIFWVCVWQMMTAVNNPFLYFRF